jgi:hypothetical protein
MYKVLSAESCTDGETQRPAAAANQNFHQTPPPHPPSERLLHAVVSQEVEQHFLGRGTDIVIRETCVHPSLKVNKKSNCAASHLLLSSNSHRFRVICSPHPRSSFPQCTSSPLLVPSKFGPPCLSSEHLHSTQACQVWFMNILIISALLFKQWSTYPGSL